VIVVEDGSIVAGANSYVTLTDARNYATQRGVSLPTDDVVLEGLIVRASDYLDLIGDYLGSPSAPDQELEWPRTSFSGIPKKLISAQCELTIEGVSFGDLMPSSDGREVLMENIGGKLITQYAESGSALSKPIFPKVERLLSSLRFADKFSIPVVRG